MTRSRLISIITATLLCLYGTVSAVAQNVDDDSYRYDIGVNLGMSGYAGDANTNLMKHIGFGGQLSMRYMPNSRMAFRAVLSGASLSGNTADTDNALPEGAQYEFTASNFDLSVRYEFNFFAYGIGETYSPIYPLGTRRKIQTAPALEPDGRIHDDQGVRRSRRRQVAVGPQRHKKFIRKKYRLGVHDLHRHQL